MQSDRVGLSAQDLLSAFENAPIGMAVLTPAGVITACNAAMGRLLERDAADLIGGTFFDVTHIDDLDEARRKCALIQVEGAQIVRHECRFVLPDERIIWVSISTSRVPHTPERSAHLIMHIEDVSAANGWRPNSTTGPCTTRSPAWRTGRCSPSGCGRSWPGAAGTPGSDTCSTSTSTGSRR